MMKEARLRLILVLLTSATLLSATALAQQGIDAQQDLANNSVAHAALAEGSDSADRYRIGPGDILEVRVFNRPQLSREAIRVDARGMIRIPLIENEILAACRTETELAKEIATHYLEYLRNPSVEVFVKEFQSQPVAILGAVNSPGRFQLQRRVRLLELLSYAGGQAERAGGRVQVIHTPGVSVCKEAASGESLAQDQETFDSYNLNDILRGDENSNPYVRPGDIVSVPESEKAFVVGNVLKPSTIPLKEPITVSQAIAFAGGVMPDTKSEKVRIIRQLPGSTGKTEIYIDLKGIDKRRAEDVLLQPNDIVDVPMSGGRRFLRSLVSAIAPAVSNMPVRVIR